jgi:hypothetical protein
MVNGDGYFNACTQFQKPIYLWPFIVERFAFCPYCGRVLKIGSNMPGSLEGKNW